MKFDKIYIDKFKSDKNKYLDDYKELITKVSNSTAYYNGKPVKFPYTPYFLEENDHENFRNIVSTLMSIFDKVTNKYLEDKQYRKHFKFNKIEEELICIDPGYEMNAPICRLDLFYKDINNFAFCEFNTDGTSAMNETNEIERIFLTSQILADLNEYEFSYTELMELWVNTSLDIFNRWQKNKGIDIKPTIAIVDYVGGTVSEFTELKKIYEKKGYTCYVIDVYDLEEKDGELYYNNQKIDMVYRRFVTSSLMKNFEKSRHIYNSMKSKKVCFIGNLRSQVPHNKNIFRVLHLEDTLEFLSNEERTFIKNHIPATRELLGFDISELKKHKNKYVLKPKDLYGSKGVYLGIEYSDSEWIELIKEATYNIDDYLVQDFIKPYERDMIKFTNEEKTEYKIDRFRNMTGLFVYDGKYVGAYDRVNDREIITDIYGGMTAPIITVKRK